MPPRGAAYPALGNFPPVARQVPRTIKCGPVSALGVLHHSLRTPQFRSLPPLHGDPKLVCREFLIVGDVEVKTSMQMRIMSLSHKEDMIVETSDQDWNFCMDVNARGVFNCLRAQLRAMKAGSSIVSTSKASDVMKIPS